MMASVPGTLSAALAPFLDPSFHVVARGALVLGALSGLSGVFLVLSRRSLVGDVLAHASIPGMALAWLLCRENAIWVFTLGAFCSLCLAWLTIAWFSTRRTLHADAALSCTLALFFGLGLMLLTEGAKRPGFGETGLERVFLGSLATILPGETTMGFLLLTIFVVFLVTTWPTLQRVLFDPEGSRVRGLPMRAVRTALATLLLVSLALSMRSLGVLLLLSLCVTPALLARHLTRGLADMCLLSALLGAGFSLAGGGWSALPDGPPTGPAIVLVASLSLLTYLTIHHALTALSHARNPRVRKEEQPRVTRI